MRRSAGGAEEVDLRAEAEHEIVVGDRCELREADGPRVEIDRGHAGLVDRRVVVVSEQIAQGMPHSRRVEQPGGELVEERLERVVVVPVDENDLGVGVLELLRRADSGEPAAEDQDTGTSVTGHRDLQLLQVVARFPTCSRSIGRARDG